jgi:hypothetical protein
MNRAIMDCHTVILSRIMDGFDPGARNFCCDPHCLALRVRSADPISAL